MVCYTVVWCTIIKLFAVAHDNEISIDILISMYQFSSFLDLHVLNPVWFYYLLNVIKLYTVLEKH